MKTPESPKIPRVAPPIETPAERAEKARLLRKQWRANANRARTPKYR